MPGKFVHRAYTVAELSHADRCVVCGRATAHAEPLDLGRGASIEAMTAPLPLVRLCESCAAAQRIAMTAGRGAVALAMVGPIVVVALVALVAPFGSPLSILAAGFGALVAARIVVGRVRARRAHASRVLFVDGALDALILQLALVDSAAGEVPYRALGSEARTDGFVVSPVGPRVRATVPFIASTLAVAVGCVVGWLGSYPTVTVDNPSDADVSIRIDRREIPVPSQGSRRLTLAWGRHTFEGADLDVPWGKRVLVSLAPRRCYEIARPGAPRGVFRHAQGPVIVMDPSERATRAARCDPD